MLAAGFPRPTKQVTFVRTRASTSRLDDKSVEDEEDEEDDEEDDEDEEFLISEL